MKLRRKHKIAILAIGTGLTATGLFTTIQSLQLSAENRHKYNVNSTLKTFLDNDESDPKNSIVNTYDANLERKPQDPEPTPPQKEIEKPVPIVTEPPKIIEPAPEPVQPDPIKPEPEPVPVPAPVPPVVDPAPVPPDVVPEPEPVPIKPDPEPYQRVQRRERREINQGGIKYLADIDVLNPPRDESYDIQKGLANRVPYQNEFEEVTGITGALTEENIRLSGVIAAKGAKKNDYIFQTKGVGYYDLFHNETQDIENLNNYLDKDGGAPEQLGNLYARYERLLNNPELLKTYVDETALKNWDRWWNDTKIVEWTPYRSNQKVRVPYGKLLILMHIDHNKIKKVSAEVQRQLSKGYVIPDEYTQTWVNEKGEWESYTFSPPVNNVQRRYTEDNKYKKVLGNNSQWPTRNSDDIRRGKYANWTDTNLNQEFINRGYGDLIKGYGITITKYTRNEAIENVSRTEATVVEIDVEQPNAYKNAQELIERLQRDKIEITGYRIKNIGRVGADQNMDKIFAALPNKLPLLELFFASKNTSAIRFIKDKEIDELAMYTDQKLNGNANDWAINPWALNKVAWVNMNDYNVNWAYLNSDERIYTRITFDNLSFDEEDVKGSNSKFDLTKVNDGLRMAYWTRNNERIFQGGWGGGNKPDSGRDGNSYPLGVDFSNAPSIKTLAGMVFRDILGKNSSVRRLKRIKLYNNSDTWEVSAAEMNIAQFSDILITEGPQTPDDRSKIFFSNGKTTKKIKFFALSPGTGESLNAKGISNLRTLISWSDNTFNSNTEIIVQTGETKILETLKSAGFNARFETEDDLYQVI
ncbi:putative immunoglobulin-blocking virulence protein [Mycoplasmopsis bovirhinis]|uniref:Immunoglobulin-blocking virulence protein n=1 Tax=Mycoplasmopsis bovirhinis TaxID=29553 RepID=A0A449ACJ6_9BACT|nr:putative immunoglobulin-blocking virulence protein [Mycoplasmopsis bovirhinis]VEU62612.1 Uncharacterised protein [Mycoplasmopsis bovirhinis]